MVCEHSGTDDQDRQSEISAGLEIEFGRTPSAARSADNWYIFKRGPKGATPQEQTSTAHIAPANKISWEEQSFSKDFEQG